MFIYIRSVIDAIAIACFACVFAFIEIEVEGPDGWAKNLPTPQNVLGHLSLYHVFMVSMAAIVIAGFIYFRSSCTASNDNKCNTLTPITPWWKMLLTNIGTFVFHLVLFFLVQDFLWFVFNPAYTIKRYKQSCIPWHKQWFLGIPSFNFMGAAMIAFIIALSPVRKQLGVSVGAYAGCVALAVAVSPLYHTFYRNIHSTCIQGNTSGLPSRCGATVNLGEKCTL